MTGDELERAIDFLLKSQARAEARIEQQGADFQKRLDSIAEAHASLEASHDNLVRVLTQTLEAQSRINEQRRAADESLRAGQESLLAVMAELAGRQGQTEATVDRLSQKVEALAEQTAGTDRRLGALIKIVEEERNRGR